MANFPSCFLYFVIVVLCTFSLSSQSTTPAPEATTVGATDENVTTAPDDIKDPCSEFTDADMCCKDTIGGLFNCSYCFVITADPVSKVCSSVCEGDEAANYCVTTEAKESSTTVSPDTADNNSTTANDTTTTANDTTTTANDTTTTPAASDPTTAVPTTANDTTTPSIIPTTAPSVITTSTTTSPAPTGPTVEPITGCGVFTATDECCNNNCSYCVNITNDDQGCHPVGECLILNNTDVCEKPVEPTTAPNGTDTTPSASGGDSDGQRFDGASFIGGVILCGGLVALIFFGLKFYKSKKETNYHTL